MGDNFYTATTAALKVTKADIRNLNAQEIKLKNKNILDHIKDSEFKSYDTRDPQLKNDELDIWNTEISLSEEGHIEVKPLEHDVTTVTEEQFSTIRDCVKVINNEVLDANDNHLMYWQTDGLTISYGKRKVQINSVLPPMDTNCSFFYVDSPLTSITGKIQIFNSDLSSLTNGGSMFYGCASLTSFTGDLSSLTDGNYMFRGCSNLMTFTSDLSSLTNGRGMFMFCNQFTSFTSDLSSLTNGDSMFSGCKLDARSVANIIHILPKREEYPDLYTGNITLGIGCDNTEADQLLFAQECDCETWQELLDDFSAKNWNVYFGCNGRPTTTYTMRRGETLPVYTKLEKVTEGEHYAYTSQDGSKFYNIKYFHSTNGSTEGYDIFSSLEEAISTYNVTSKN